MKKLSTFVLSLLITCACAAQDLNGWEFLPWKTGKDSVERILSANKGKLENANALDAYFRYQGMNTWLVYDASNALVQVRQRATFSVIQDKEAKAFFTSFKDMLVKKYGKPKQRKNDAKNKVITMHWELTYTAIDLEYDHKYKVIDEFGAGSYWIEVVFECRQVK
jgi:hypothetical protein